MIREKDIERFWSKVDKSGECWLWKARTDRDGYGVFIVTLENGRREQRANRAALIIELGRDLVKGEQSLHHCDNPPCVRVGERHIFLGDAKTNVKDRDEKGRGYSPGPINPAVGKRNGMHTHPGIFRGAKNPRAKLTEDQVRDLRTRRAKGERLLDLSNYFGVSLFQVSQIARGLSWKHVR